MDERDHIAAERALGHEPRARESAEEARLREAWERRLAPLLDAPPVAPSPGLFARIEAELEPAGMAGGAEIIPLRRQVRLWRAVAGAALAAAAALALWIAVPTERAGERYVAVVTADTGGEAGLIIQFDTGTGIATVIPVTAPPSGNSYEMWTIPEGRTQPVSLGLLPQDAALRPGFSAMEGQVFAISLEPEGGSPTGQPTRPLYHGNLVRVD